MHGRFGYTDLQKHKTFGKLCEIIRKQCSRKLSKFRESVEFDEMRQEHNDHT